MNYEYSRIVNCGTCKYHSYDWCDDLEEFETCEKEHTKQLMYNHFCEEWRYNGD